MWLLHVLARRMVALPVIPDQIPLQNVAKTRQNVMPRVVSNVIVPYARCDCCACLLNAMCVGFVMLPGLSPEIG